MTKPKASMRGDVNKLGAITDCNYLPQAARSIIILFWMALFFLIDADVSETGMEFSISDSLAQAEREIYIAVCRKSS